MFELLRGALAIALEELRFSVKKKTFLAYIFFAIAFGISIYATYTQPYGSPQAEVAGLPFGIQLEQGVSPLIDITIFMLSLTASALGSTGMGAASQIVLPVDIGVTLFIIAPILIGITAVSRLATRLCASSFAREKESKTAYHLVASPQPRAMIYMSKMAGSTAALLPMIILMFMASAWVIETSFIPHMETADAAVLKLQVLIASAVTTLLFASIAMMISTISRNEEDAVNRSGWTIRVMSSMATIWIFLPILKIADHQTASIVENIVMVSPITLDMIALYSGHMFNEYMLIQLVTAIAFLIIGMWTFIRQDIEY